MRLGLTPMAFKQRSSNSTKFSTVAPLKRYKAWSSSPTTQIFYCLWQDWKKDFFLYCICVLVLINNNMFVNWCSFFQTSNLVVCQLLNNEKSTCLIKGWLFKSSKYARYILSILVSVASLVWQSSGFKLSSEKRLNKPIMLDTALCLDWLAKPMK